MTPKPASQPGAGSAWPEVSPTPPPDDKAARIVWWRQVLSGQAAPEVLKAPPEVEERLKEEEERWRRQGSSITTAARRRILEDWTLQMLYGGQPVACYDTGAGRAVIASGPTEVAWLEESLSPQEVRHVVVEFPDPW